MDIGHYLKEQGVAFEVHEHPPAYTAQEVAANEHVSGHKTAKAVLVRAGTRFTLCVLPASHRLNLDKVAELTGSENIRLANEIELAGVFPDVEVGTEPPFGCLYNIDTMVDSHLAAQEEILFQAGTHHSAIQMSYADYESLVKPTVADLAVHL